MQRSGPIERIVVMEKVGGNNAGAYLSFKEVSAVAGGINLKIEYRDLKAKASAVDPAQVEHMDSFAVLSSDSEEAAATHMALMTGPDSGMHDMDETIGDASVSLEANQGGMGSVVAFKKGEWVVSLHTSHPNGDTPLMDRAALENLARAVTGRL
ncbi:MAG: hypothetical protein CL895_08990 [Dehalococcoidia bacterium]|nr:hypothetical protein [Dehalococcoidia bacterium]